MVIYLKICKILTLQSVYKHKFNDLSKNIGNADITSLVNFDLYKKYFYIKIFLLKKLLVKANSLQKWVF